MAISGISAPKYGSSMGLCSGQIWHGESTSYPSAEFAYSTYIATKFSLGKRCTQEYRL